MHGDFRYVIESVCIRARDVLSDCISSAKQTWTVLMVACSNKNKAIVDLLLKRGAAVNQAGAVR